MVKETKIKIDEIDRKIIMILQDNGRETLKNIAKQVKLSVDAVHKRVRELIKNKVIKPTIYIEDPTLFNLNLFSVGLVRLKSCSREEKARFIKTLSNYPRCNDVVEYIGNYDFLITLGVEDYTELAHTIEEFKEQFRDIIEEWNGLTSVKVHKYDTYNL